MEGDNTEFRCSCGKIVVDAEHHQVRLETSQGQQAEVEPETLARVIDQANQPHGLISCDTVAEGVDHHGHRVQVTVHHRPSERCATKTAHLRVDDHSALQIEAWQLSALRRAL